MSIDYSRLRTVSARELAGALLSDGYTLARQKGSHRHFHHADGRRVTLSFHHPSDTFRFGTLKSIVETQARWTAEDLCRLKLIH